MAKKMSIFDEEYRVIAIEGDSLVIQGILTGNILTITNPELESPLSLEEYPLGKRIVLSDPSDASTNQDYN